MKSKYQKDWDRGESFVFVGKGLYKELVPVKYVVAKNKTTGDEIDYIVWKKMSNEEQDHPEGALCDLYELEEMS